MVVEQSFNKKTKAWVKFKVTKGKGAKIINVKQQNPTEKFKGVPVRKK